MRGAMRKKPPLVSQYLEKISRKALEQHQDLLAKFVRRRHGIYALYRKNRLCYVGLAQNLRGRLWHHLRDRHADGWDSFSVYLTIDSAHLRELEALAIRIASPKENRQKGRLRSSQDLRKLFRKSVTQYFRTQLNDLFGGDDDGVLSNEGIKEVVEGRRPVLAGYFAKGQRLRFRYKNRLFRAFLKKNGTIRLLGKIYTSPSHAAQAIVKHGINGWRCWTYERAPGDWVALDELRK
jgi:hypothetical protein